MEKEAVFVYGDNIYSKQFIDHYNGTIYVDQLEFDKADKYVLVADDKENIDFYNKHRKKLKEKEVYLKHSFFQNASLDNVNFFSLEMMVARRFWKEYSLVNLAFENGKVKDEMNIVLVGVDRLAQQVLYEGLMVNIFDAKQIIKYHLFGDYRLFHLSHDNSEELNIIYHDECCLENKDLLENADIVLFFGSQEKLYTIMSCITKGNFVLFSDDYVNAELFVDHCYGKANNLNLSVFNYADGVCTANNIFNVDALAKAKVVNHNFSSIYNKEDKRNVQQQWNALSALHKGSNISVVDFFECTIIKLTEKLFGKPYEQVTDEEFEKYCIDVFAELEHIQWCRFYLYHNWSYSPIADKGNRKHNCLVSFDTLSKEEQYKDTVQLMKIRELMKGQ